MPASTISGEPPLSCCAMALDETLANCTGSVMPSAMITLMNGASMSPIPAKPHTYGATIHQPDRLASCRRLADMASIGISMTTPQP
ncbi:hypothetical protein G1C98_1287 [Bifidobacterium sp. DSM 109960]|uniref:Uncharacterized protein n=1 Tax=Bifidobacterium erythrocebi TaxID=2675325 RepID=A0A7Y0EWC9_9BIFI|nr:hypothetical protein [Bifidobacterium sp. DSM 109960]